MVSMNIFFFILGFLSYIFYKKFFKNRKKYLKINRIIENKIFKESSETILKEQLNRNYLFFGDDGMKLIRNSTVFIINCENIGSHIAVTLARSGIKKLILADNNKLKIDNYKYHPFATLEDLNKDNLYILNNYIKQVNPNTELVLINKAINYDNKELYSFLKKENIDYIVDCSPEKDILLKINFMNYIKINKIKLISIRYPLKYQNDPTLIRHSKFYSFISEYDNDNSKYLKNIFFENYKKVYNNKEELPNFTIIFSSQKNENNINKNKENLFLYGVMADSASSIILCDLAHFQFEKNELIENILKNRNEQKISGKNLSEAIQDYKREEIDINKCDKKDIDKLNYNDFRNICSLFKNGSCLQMKQVPKMKFIRWRIYKIPSKDNIVMMGKDEIKNHLKIKNEEELIQYYGKDIINRIDEILKKV